MMKMANARNKVVRDGEKGDLLKRFSSRERFLKEVHAREYFGKYWRVPRILGTDEKNLELRIEHIKGERMDKIIDSLDFDTFLEFICRIEKNPPLDRPLFTSETSYDISMVKKGGDTTAPLLRKVDFNHPRLIHGDFRPYNVIRSNGEYCIFDLEFAQNGIIEKDIAKFYVECLSLNPRFAEKIRNFVRSRGNYFNFLFYCLFTGYKQLETGFYRGDDVRRFIQQVSEEIRRIEEPSRQ